MPLPIAAAVPTLAVWALRAGVAGAAVWALRRAAHRGRTDQRAEDALDDLGDGLAAHAPRDRDGQRNAAMRLRRVIRWQGGGIEIDLAAMGRLRLRRLGDDPGRDSGTNGKA
ncbi:MAG: hypothetical protein KF887_04170 [Paracoccaceae bacterium]|nr:MAG: hypothetical protein KF887_04170 [Paracoccaceae bacterium]